MAIPPESEAELLEAIQGFETTMSSQLENTSVLVVDDDADTCDLLRFTLEQSGASVTVASSVEAALEKFRRTPAHAIVADIRLGSSDGYALIKAVRELNLQYRGFTPAVAITGYGSPEDEQRAMTAGFNAYLPKPLDPRELVSAIARVLRPG
jgi:CheY-like chemotaxis protein